MPPRKKDPIEDPAENDGLCPEHYPHGWSHVPEQFAGVGCEHGTWARPANDETDNES